MINISSFTSTFLETLRKTFGDRVWFVGLQGSYARNEATSTSDIDMVVILDKLSASDILAYDSMLNTLPHRDRLCGFLSGKEELLRWEPSDLFQFYYDTKPLYGSLDILLSRIDQDAVKRAIRIGACNIYHGCVHNMLYEKSEEILAGLYKSASFVIQAICFQETGRYITHQKDLSAYVNPDERKIADTYIALKHGKAVDFKPMSETLLVWCQKQINKTQ